MVYTPLEKLEKEQQTLQEKVLRKLMTDPYSFAEDIQRSSTIPSNITDICCLFSDDNQEQKQEQKRGLFCVKREVVKLTDNIILVELKDGSHIKLIGDVYKNVKQTAHISETPCGRIKNIRHQTTYSVTKYYLGTDKYTNELLINFIMNQLWKSAELPQFNLRLVASAVCSDLDSKQNQAINLYPMSTGDLSNLPDSFKDSQGYVYPYHVDNILRQVTLLLSFLGTNIDFTHGNLTLEKVIIKSEVIGLVYDELDVDGHFRCMITDFSNACATFKTANTRLYSYSKQADVYCREKPFDNHSLDTQHYIIYEDNDVLKHHIRHMGLPFHKGFDFYTFLVSMMLHEHYRYTIDNYFEWLYSDLIWNAKEVDLLLDRLDEYRGQTGYEVCLNVLKGLTLNSNVVEDVMEELRNQELMQPPRQYLSPNNDLRYNH